LRMGYFLAAQIFQLKFWKIRQVKEVSIITSVFLQSQT
jgi:hypothetical protein